MEFKTIWTIRTFWLLSHAKYCRRLKADAKIMTKEVAAKRDGLSNILL